MPHWMQDSNWWLVIIAACTGFVISWQTFETRRSVQISTKALVAQFRPKIVVRETILDPCATVYFDRRQDGQWKVIIRITNAGGTKAVISEGHGYFQEYQRTTPQRELSPCWILESPITIFPGEIIDIEYNLDAETFKNYMKVLETSTTMAGKQPLRAPIFHGVLKYRDDIGITRETGFGRRWDVVAQRFALLDDPKFEYED